MSGRELVSLTVIKNNRSLVAILKRKQQTWVSRRLLKVMKFGEYKRGGEALYIWFQATRSSCGREARILFEQLYLPSLRNVLLLALVCGYFAGDMF